MASLTIKDIPPELLEQLKARAEAERRSLTQEVIMLLSEAMMRPSAEGSRPSTPQVDAWRKLAGEWQSNESAAEEIESIYEARTRGRQVDL